MSRSSVTRETVAEKKVRLWAENNGIVCVKVLSSTAGYPDRLFILPNGVHIWIEFKAKGRVPRLRQLYRMGELRDQGALVGWTDDADVGISTLKTFMEAPPLPGKGNTLIAVSERGRAFHESWARQKQYVLSGPEDIEIERLKLKNTFSGSFARHAEGMA